MARVHLLLACLLLPLAACQSIVLVDDAEGGDYRVVFTDGSWLEGPVELEVIVTFVGGDELWLPLAATSGEMASRVARTWVREINRRRPGSAEVSANTFVLRDVLRIERVGRIRGLAIRPVPPPRGGTEAEEPQGP